MTAASLPERAAGAIVGAFVGDALGLGPHWYYDLEQLRREHGEWIGDYTEPRPGRYHDGMKAGQASQSGLILAMTLESLVARGGYDEADFCRRIDEELFARIDGTPRHGPGGYTSQSMRDAWRCRIEQGLAWDRCGGHADTTEAIERTLAIAVRFSGDLAALADTVAANARLTQSDPTIVSMTVAFGAVLAMLVQGHRLDHELSGKLMNAVHSGVLPFHAVTGKGLSVPGPDDPDPPRMGQFASPDALLTPSYMARAAVDPDIRIEPAWKVSIVYGMPCAIYHQLPAAYYLAARFADDFESAVLHAINGGGQNLARAMLCGALVGAQVGLEGIPRRFREGLQDGERVERLARELAASVA